MKVCGTVLMDYVPCHKTDSVYWAPNQPFWCKNEKVRKKERGDILEKIWRGVEGEVKALNFCA